ncbi:MAG: methyltransferase domain-containing protein, partial [Undibacterium sp.]|nr:methyltransferase domain-containing protein [Undibacterium sp.]
MLSADIDLALVRRFFSRADAAQASDFLRREIASRMHEKLELINISASRVLDAGCGLGADLPHLLSRFPKAQIVGLDGSCAALCEQQAMQQAADQAKITLWQKILPRALQTQVVSEVQLLCADFAQLGIASNTIDVLWSNMALHWHPQPDLVLAEWRRVLNVNGMLMFSCFGPDSLREVRTAFQDVDNYPHVLPFVDMHD